MLPWAISWLWSRDYLMDVSATPMLLDANLGLEEALDWRKWTKGDPFVLGAVFIELSCCESDLASRL